MKKSGFEGAVPLDDTDRKILNLLLEDGSRSKAEIARLVSLTPNAIFERIRKLEERGVLQGYRAIVDPHRLGCKLLAFVFVSESKPVTGEKTGLRLARTLNVEEVHRVAGKDCFLMKIRATDTEGLRRILDRIGEIESVSAVETTIVLETFREKSFDAVPNAASEDGSQ